MGGRSRSSVSRQTEQLGPRIILSTREEQEREAEKRKKVEREAAIAAAVAASVAASSVVFKRPPPKVGIFKRAWRWVWAVIGPTLWRWLD